MSRRVSKTPEQRKGAERRRVGVVVHDDRGNGMLEWHDSPNDSGERPVLEILDGPPPELALVEEQNCDPYSSRGQGTGATSIKTDLRKLSEHIKKMRELEARKREEEKDK
ncbi:MAG TPA: hypothetical protein VEH54_01690 [Steroidobacteraceae bacterium]|nr:hypothetical protein [Steroidobacteraceae bacterium]